MNNLPPGYIELDETHFPECDDQPEGAECICLDIKERMVEDEADNRIHDVE